MTTPSLKGDVKLTLSSRLPQAKPAYWLNCFSGNVYFIGQQYIRAQANIRPVRAWSARDSTEASQLRKDTDTLNATSRFRVLGNFIKQIRVFLLKARAQCAQGRQKRKDSTMTNFKLLSVAAILSTAIVTPVFAQQAVQEPGAQAFYQSLGVGSHDGSTASAMASVRTGSFASAPLKRVSTKRYTDRKMWQGRANKPAPDQWKRRSNGRPFLLSPSDILTSIERAEPFRFRQSTPTW
jgi:hypothetical protein